MDNTEYKQTRKFLDCVDDNFLLEALEKPTNRDDMPVLLLNSKEGLVWNVKASGSFGWILTVSGRVHIKPIL